MRLRLHLAALAAVWCVAVCGAGTEARADETRTNATVKAVRKVKPSVVAIKVPGATASAKGTVGTGVIIDERGYIVTNRHVVAQAEKILVRLVDESEFSATVVVADGNTDLAILSPARPRRRLKSKTVTQADIDAVMAPARLRPSRSSRPCFPRVWA